MQAVYYADQVNARAQEAATVRERLAAMSAPGPRYLTALLERLRQMTDAVPPGGAVTLQRDWLEAELQAVSPALGQAGDLTVQQIAEELHRPESTIRGWLGSGRFAGSYKRGRAWRVRTALKEGKPAAPRRAEPARLDAWRRVVR